MTGEDMTRDCSSNNNALQTLCSLYLVGALDMMDSLEVSTEIPDMACVPTDVTGGQMGKVVAKYGKDHPEDLHMQAATFMIKSFQTAWPCR